VALRRIKAKFEERVKIEFPCDECKAPLGHCTCDVELKPQFFMCDDDLAEHAAIRSVFPWAIVLLCHWHLHCHFWKDVQTLLPEAYRSLIHALMKIMMRTKRRAEFNRSLRQLTKLCKEAMAFAFWDKFSKYLERQRKYNTFIA
jgi:hypothetical protein